MSDSTHKSHSKFLTFFFITALVLILLAFAGCASSNEPPQSTSNLPSTPKAFQEPPAQDLTIVQFGEVFTYPDGVSVSVSTPTPFTPTEWSSYSANPDVKQWYYFKIVLTNNSQKPLDPFTYETVSSGGVESPSVFDYGNEIGAIGEAPMTSVLPGQTVEWLVGYGIADPAAITFDIQPGFEYEETTFTNILP